MPFIGVQPASALLTSADIQDGQITTAKVADDAVTGAKIENNPTIAGNLAVSGTTTLSDNIVFGASGKGVHLGVTTATASNLVDDFEEGTFNLTMVGGSGSPSSTQTLASEYVKVGKLVTFRTFQSGVNNTGASGHIYFSGVPFTPTGVCIVNIDINGQGTFSEGTPTGYLSGNIIYINQIRSNLGYNTVTHNVVSSAEWSLTGHFFTNS